MDWISREKTIKAIKSLWSEAWGSFNDEHIYETNEYAKGLLDAIDAVNDVLGEERTDKTMINKPMNPYAERDFAHAVREASTKFGEDLKKIGEQMKAEFPFMDEPYVAFKDFEESDSGIMHLNYLSGKGAWEDVMHTLLIHGYEVTARLENATETERELDGVEKWIVIEYGEVE